MLGTLARWAVAVPVLVAALLAPALLSDVDLRTPAAWPVWLAVALFGYAWRKPELWWLPVLVAALPYTFHSYPVFLAVLVATTLAWRVRGLVTPLGSAALARSPVEVVLPTRDGSRLRVGGRALFYEQLAPPGDDRAPARLVIPFHRVEFVEAGTMTDHTRWGLPNTSTTVVERGAVVRIVGAGQQWLLTTYGATEPITAFLTRRIAARAKATTRPTAAAARWWPHAPANPEDVTRTERKRGVAGLLDAWRDALWPARAVEEQPRPPDAGPWGETRPGVAPVPGYHAQAPTTDRA
ncbi:hypothetical protein [Actinosynnema sp. NPDC020468]|uniref:hypothetical protein n=1 Tax=Actinosynnema sp. NPDC020468 TaxID=3154488 RepID=UPI0033E16172